MGSVIVACAILALIASVGIIAILKYKTVEEALKVWGVLSGLMGVVTGAFVTYFFTHPQIVEAKRELKTAQTQLAEAKITAEVASQEIEELWKSAENLKTKFVTLSDSKAWGAIKSEPEIVQFIQSVSAEKPKIQNSGTSICEIKNGVFVCFPAKDE